MEKFPHKGTRLSWQREKYQITSLHTTVFFYFISPYDALPDHPPLQPHAANPRLWCGRNIISSPSTPTLCRSSRHLARCRRGRSLQKLSLDETIGDNGRQKPAFQKPSPIIRNRFDGISLQVNSTSAKSCLAIRKWPHPPFHLRSARGRHRFPKAAQKASSPLSHPPFREAPLPSPLHLRI